MLKRVYLEITNACNLDCPFCTNEKGNKFLSLKEIEDCIVQIKKFCDYIYLHILGEPTLHPNFNEVLNILDKHNMNLQLVTNGTLLYKYKDILNHKCIRKLSISLHSINNINISDNYFHTINELISNNIDKSIELRFYDRNSLANNLKEYLQYLINKYNFDITSKNNSYKLKENVYVYFEEFFKWPNINDQVISSYGTCHGAIDMIAINSNLDVTICCLDPKAYNCIGNLKNTSLSDILNSEMYLSYINDFKSRKINSDFCKRCSYRLRFK